jgi:hypothetical protein
MPKSLPWRYIQHWNKTFEKANLKMLRFKRSRSRLKKRKLQGSMLMSKEHCRSKMYHDLKSKYWWYGMKRSIAEYVALCDNCQ